MAQALQYVFTVISSAVAWLGSWSYMGVSFIYFLIGLAVMGIILRFVF